MAPPRAGLSPAGDTIGPLETVSNSGDDLIPVGQIHGVFGVRGWLKVRPFTRPPEGIFSYRHWRLGESGNTREHHVASFRADGDNFLVKLRGISTREAAEALNGSVVSVPVTALPPLDDGQFYWRDLVGLTVLNTEGVVLGTVSGLLETGANDVMVVDGVRQRLIPFVRGRYVVSVDLVAGQMVVDWHPDD